MRVHLADGSIAVFPRGVRIEPSAVVGVAPGTLHAFALTDFATVREIEAARIVAIQAFGSELRIVPSVAASVGAYAAVSTITGIVLFFTLFVPWT